jgi:hypothetical protein
VQSVQVCHVGGSGVAVIPNADFRTEGEGDLIVFRDRAVIAHFPAGKWSSAVRVDAPDGGRTVPSSAPVTMTTVPR